MAITEHQALSAHIPDLDEVDWTKKHVIAALRNTIDSQRLHHAYLLTGTRGIGKTTIARIIAKCLECQDGISSHPHADGKLCDNCQAIIKGAFPDVIEIDAASQTKVEDTRRY